MKRSYIPLAVSLVLLPMTGAVPILLSADDRAVLGWVEWITIDPWGFTIKTRLDTGAKTASLQAEDIRRFKKKNNNKWVHFTLSLNDAENESSDPSHPKIEVALPLERDVLIKEHSGSHDRRPVVLMDVCSNGERHTAEFSLKDRSALNYPVLLGRGFPRSIALVDSARTFLDAKDCPAT